MTNKRDLTPFLFPNVSVAAMAFGESDTGCEYDNVNYYTWTRVKPSAMDACTTKVYSYPVNVSHGGIGGAPGYAGWNENWSSNWTMERLGSIYTDRRIRARAIEAGVPVNQKELADYGFPVMQADLPKPK